MKSKNIVVVIVVTLAMLSSSMLIYLNDYYEADSWVYEILQEENVEQLGDYTILHGNSDIGIIFYPGAKVEAEAYLPILQKLQNHGFTCILVHMPFNMAIFNVAGADGVFDLLPNISNWYMAGHSMGGGMASSYASENQDRIKGLLLLGAYVYGDFPVEKALTIYGSYNSNLEEKIDYTENILIIEGGNHAKFGNYGEQKGDPNGDITHEQQQDIAVETIVDFIIDLF